MTTALLAIAIGLTLIAAALAPRGAVLAAALALTACPGAQTEARAADAIARSANVATASLAETYALRGEALVEAADSREEALALLDQHRERWAPLWRAVDALAAAHEAWALSVETGRTSPETLAALRDAWCEAARLAAELGAPVPEVVPCP